MIRPRKKDRHLPPCMYLKHGAYWHVRGRKWRRLADNLPEALRAYARVHLASLSGGIDALAQKWIDQLDAELAENTRKQYMVAVAKIRSAFREFTPADILPTDVAQWLDSMADKPNMANRCRSVLKLMMDLAVRHGEAPSNPVVSVPRFTEKKRDRYITDSEYLAVRKVAQPWLQLVMDCCYLTGQRIEDVLSIRLSDISDDGIAFKPEKTKRSGKRILVAMTPELAEVINQARKAAQGNVRSLYLLPARGGKKRIYTVVRDAWRAACDEAKVQDAHIHDLRAKALTDADNQGLNAQLLGGHASRQMTERYIRLRKTDIATPPSMGGNRSKSA